MKNNQIVTDQFYVKKLIRNSPKTQIAVNYSTICQSNTYSLFNENNKITVKIRSSCLFFLQHREYHLQNKTSKEDAGGMLDL